MAEFFVSGPNTKIFGSLLNVSVEFSPKKPPETRFCDLRSNNATVEFGYKVNGYKGSSSVVVHGFQKDLVIEKFTCIVVIGKYIFRCWLNLGHDLMLGTVLPVGISCILAVILVEATGTGNFSPLPSTDKAKVLSAQ